MSDQETVQEGQKDLSLTIAELALPLMRFLETTFDERAGVEVKPYCL